MRILPVSILALTTLAAGPAAAQEAPATRLYADLDLAGRYNPVGLAAMGEVGVRHVMRVHPKYELPSHSLGLGLRGSVNPANAQAGAVVRYQPAVFAHLELGYERYAYFGANGALLSYGDAGASFGDETRKARAGEEEAAGGDRLSTAGTLQLAAGRWYARHQTRASWYHFGGSGPWYYEWEHDTLLSNSDWVVVSKTSLAYALWEGDDEELLILGPTHDVTHAVDAAITRHRVAGGAYLQLSRRGLLGRPHAYLEAGTPVVDRHRAGEVYFIGLVGTSW